MRTRGKSAARERRDPMNETEESAALFYSPRRRSRDQIDQDVSQGQVYPLADVLFKFPFARPERAELFLDLLNALMFPNRERAFTQVAFIDRERSPARALGKGSRLDIVARLDEEMVNLEVQVRHEPGYLKRTLYYWSLLYSTSLERREKYIDTVRTISRDCWTSSCSRRSGSAATATPSATTRADGFSATTSGSFILNCPKHAGSVKRAAARGTGWNAGCVTWTGCEVTRWSV